MLWSLGDPRPDGLLASSTRTSSTAEPTVWDEGGTYVETDAMFSTTSRTSGTTASARSSRPCSSAGWMLTTLVEHDSVPWDALPGQMEELGRRRVAARGPPRRLPHSYTISATKTATLT